MRDECAEFADRLSALLRERELTQPDLGRRMAATASLRGLREIAPVPRQTVSEWVRGRRMPAADYALILCHTLEVTPARLALEGLLTQDRIDEVMAAAGRHRRPGVPTIPIVGPQQDLESVHLTAVLHSTRTITRHDVHAQWGLTLELLEMRRHLSALAMLPTLSSHMVGLRTMMSLAEGDRVRRDLGMQVAEVSCATAQLWHTQLDLGRAMSGYQFALRLADQFDEDSVRAMAFTGMALLYADQLHEGEGLPGPASTSVDLMEQAERAAVGCAPSHQLWVHAARSWQRAGRRDERGAGADLDAAHRALARMSGPSRGFLGPIDESYLTVCQAKCATLLGDADRAINIYREAAAHATPQTRMFYEVERARAAIMVGRVDLAVGLLSDAIDAGTASGSTMITRRVETIVGGRLAAYRSVPEVRALEERLHSVA